MAVEDIGAVGGLLEQSANRQQGALAGPRRAVDRDELATLDRQIDVTECASVDVLDDERLANPLQANQRPVLALGRAPGGEPGVDLLLAAEQTS